MKNPSSLINSSRTFGCGDRLGITTKYQLIAIDKYRIAPILAQQSKRELDFTGRTWENVLTDASRGVEEFGYKDFWGADGDHLKNIVDIKNALNAGYTLITLDLSEKKNVSDILLFIEEAYSLTEGIADLEISIDEADSATDPSYHHFLARNFYKEGFKIFSIAPKFVGEFQKAIDYIGNLLDFENNFREHVAIADEFGYKISIHSGSDKFSIYPIISKIAKNFHIKTSGTSWLSAIETISETDNGLYLEILACACKHFKEAKKYYHIDTKNCFDLKLVNDFTDIKLRQILHITYGFVLSEFKDRILQELARSEQRFSEKVEANIEKHLSLLNIDRK